MTDDTDRDELQDALAWIRDKYGDSYPEWLRFAADMDEARDQYGIKCASWHSPECHMPVVRWTGYEAPDLVRECDRDGSDLSRNHLRLLIERYRGEVGPEPTP
jgi:hypothetical protein